MTISKTFFKPTSRQIFLAVLPILYLTLVVQLIDIEPICAHTVCEYRQPITIWQYLFTSPKFYPPHDAATHYLYHLNSPLLLELLMPIILFYLLACAIV